MNRKFVYYIIFAISNISSLSFNVSWTVSGNDLNAVIILFLNLGFLFLLFAKDRANNINAASWVVKALVEATPISGPAFVNIEYSDSLARELVGTLHIHRVDKGVYFI